MSEREERFLAQMDIDDPDTYPADPKPWQVAVIREARRRLEAEVGAWEGEFRILDEADEGMPPRGLSSSTVSCEMDGCCDPRKPISAGRE